MTLREQIDTCLKLIDENEIISFTQKLIQTPSFPPAYNEKDVAVVIAEKLREYGINSEMDDYGDNRANLRASFGGQARPNLVLSGHLDVVPPVNEGWLHDPFQAEIVDGWMWGRGTCDMKGGDAALIMAMCYLKKSGIELPGRLSFLGTLGEEAGCFGAQYFNRDHGSDDIDAVIVAEASNGAMYTSQMGALILRFTSRGVTAHPGVAWQGVNALENMLDFLERFRKYDFGVPAHPLLGKPLLNVDVIQAGDIPNALPILCTCAIDIRTVPGVNVQDIFDRINEIIAELKQKNPKFNLEWSCQCNQAPTDMDLSAPICQAAYQASLDIFGKEIEAKGTFFGTDSKELVKSTGNICDFVIYGPGDPAMNHKVNERVQVSDLVDATKFYIAMILNYLSGQNAGNQ